MSGPKPSCPPIATILGQELVPCPFCGSSKVGFYEHVYAKDFSVICQSCGAEGPSRPTHDEARNLWNERARQ